MSTIDSWDLDTLAAEALPVGQPLGRSQARSGGESSQQGNNRSFLFERAGRPTDHALQCLHRVSASGQ